MASVRENIMEMKNLSELMTEMAYSALFLRDISIANEVEGLFSRIEQLEDETLRLLFRVKESEEERIVMIDMVDYIKGIANSAKDMAALVKAKKFPRLIQDILKETDLRIITDTVAKDSILAGKSLAESRVRVHARGARIVCIKRDESWIFNVTRETKLFPGDFIVAVGTSHGEKILKDVASGRTRSWS